MLVKEAPDVGYNQHTSGMDHGRLLHIKAEWWCLLWCHYIKVDDYIMFNITMRLCFLCAMFHILIKSYSKQNDAKYT